MIKGASQLSAVTNVLLFETSARYDLMNCEKLTFERDLLIKGRSGMCFDGTNIRNPLK
jgi:hypothetical protein